MKSLDEIGKRFKTDKSTTHHGYLPLYQLLFDRIASLPEQRTLEIGVQWGLSLMTWKDYFSNPVIVGIDSVNNGVNIDGVTTLIGNAYDQRMVVQASIFGEFDIIIDDGSHDPDDQAFVIRNYFNLLNYKGILIIEDVRTKWVIPLLKAALPDGFQYTSVDICEGASMVDSRLFICWRNE